MGFLPVRKWPGGPSGRVLPFAGYWTGRELCHCVCSCLWLGLGLGPVSVLKVDGKEEWCFFLTLWADAVHLPQGFQLWRPCSLPLSCCLLPFSWRGMCVCAWGSTLAFRTHR